MNVESIKLLQRVDPVQTTALDGLISGYFNRAFLIFNQFVDDPRDCLELSETVFRTLDERRAVTELDFYGQVVERVRALPSRAEALPGVSADSVLCWLLKDSADLNYREIGEVMAFERAQVQQRIAEVRMALLG